MQSTLKRESNSTEIVMGEASKGVTVQVALHRACLGAAGSRGAYGYPGFCRCPR